MIIPDLVEPIVAYRAWQWDGTFLKSYNGQPWLAMQPLQAECRTLLKQLHSEEHGLPPGELCTCGVYAARNLEHLSSLGYLAPGVVHGEVWLWGRVWEHEMGYRAEFAYPKSLVADLFWLRCEINQATDGLKTALEKLEGLAGYNTDVSISRGARNPPELLFRKNEGAREDIVRFLLREAATWYQPRVSSLQVGDRVAVSSYGIGVVKQIINPSHNVYGMADVLMFNMELLTMRLDGIRWNQINHRWEHPTSPRFPVYARGQMRYSLTPPYGLPSDAGEPQSQP